MWKLSATVFLVVTSQVISLPFNGRRIHLNDSDVQVRADEDRKPVGLDDVIPSRFGARGFNGAWISDTEFSFYDDDGNFAKYDMTTNQETVLIERDTLARWRSPSVTLSALNTKALIRYEPRALFRHSILAKYTALDLETLEDQPISSGDELQNCIWSPTGDAVAYVRDNNVFYVDLNILDNRQVSVDGGEKIYNGITDWVYEEEVFGSYNALWFNPDGSKLVFGYFDDTDVQVASYFIYNEVVIDDEGQINGQYPEKIDLNYPKVGTANPKVKVKVLDTLNIETSVDVVEISPPEDLDEPVLASIGFADPGHVNIMWENRRQNEAVIKTYDLNDPQINSEVLSKDEPNGWIDAETMSCFEDGTDHRCFVKGNVEGWIRLIQVAYTTKDQKAITPAGVTILQFLGWNQAADEAYVIGTGYNMHEVKDPALRHLYKITGAGDFVCMSCAIESPEQEKCTYVSAVRFSKAYTYFSLTCSGPGPSYTQLIENGPELKAFSWEENQGLRETLKGFLETKAKYWRVPVGPGGQYSAMVKCLLPACYDENSNKKYPMIVDVYGGPNSVRVLDSFSVAYGDYLAQTRNTVFCRIDGRGSGNKGTDMLFTINNVLGTVEIEDQIAVTKYLRDTLNFIDPQRIGIWGWSYGGYATGMVLTHDKEHVFQGGVSVAPVSSWLYYDTIYTERYMGLPTESDNLDGYIKSNLTSYAEDMKGHEYLLIHGNADDNVHYQQAMAWAKALQHADVLFDQQSYPDEAHALSNVLPHVYHTLDEFWDRVLKWNSKDAQCDQI